MKEILHMPIQMRAERAQNITKGLIFMIYWGGLSGCYL
jgi:hypothetical protein